MSTVWIMRKSFAIRLLWLAALCLALANGRAASTNAWSVRVWQSDDGLPNNIVTSLAQTADGFLWVANPSRLARFDGVAFEQFPYRTLIEGNGQKIVSLMSSRDGSLWIATDHGSMACLKAGVIQVFTNALPDSYVETMVEDVDGALWVKNRGGGTVARVKDGQITRMPFVGNYRWLADDNRGRVWFVDNGDVGLLRKGQFATLMHLTAASSSGRITGAKGGGMWVCLGANLFKVAEGEAPVACGCFKDPLGNTEPTTMLEDHTGAVWIGTSDSGLFRYDGSSFESIAVSHRQILSLLEDREGNIWVGTGGGGLDRVQPRAVTLEGMESTLPFETVQSLCQDQNGVIWAATENGLLVCRTNGGWRTISAETNWPGGKVNCVAADKTGAVWIGTHGRKLYCLRDGQFSVISATNGIKSRTMRVLMPAANEDLWMAGNGPDSLQCLHAGKLQTIPLPPNVQMIHAMTEGTDGSIWFGTSKGVLLRCHNGVVTDETPEKEHPPSIRCMQETPDGTLWIGYAGGGLGMLNQGHYRRISTGEGLFDDHISQILADDRGWLWFGSDHGIFRVRQQELEDFANRRVKQVVSIHYGPSEGLAGLQANFGEVPGVMRGQGGRLWMPMRTALVTINPDSLPEETQPPTVLLKQIKVDDQVIAQYGGLLPVGNVADTARPVTGLRLPPDHRHLEFDFTALSFNSPENIRFQYQLEGFDNGWVDGGLERRASYSRLAEGTYQFLVRACNSGGTWSAPGAGLTFTVTPFFWQNWWFWLAVVLLFTSAVVTVVRLVLLRQLRLKVQALERQSALDRERTRIARDIHDDIGNLLTQVTLLSSLTLRDRGEPEKTGEHVQQISSTVEQVTNSLDEIVWAVNPRNDTLPQLIDYIGQFTVGFLQTAGIRGQVDLPDHPPHRVVPADVRHNVFLAVKEALNNVARHSGATEVHLRITTTEQKLELSIQDNGRSFDVVSANGSGNGLRNIRQRMDELGGRLDVESKPGIGTRITLSVLAHAQNGLNGHHQN